MNRYFFIYSIMLLSLNSSAQDTFSIVAIDLSTGEVGSAGASCINGSIIISDVHPGKGVIHTQSYYISSNQAYARNLMTQGFSPQAIINMLVTNDTQGNSTIRQYIIADLDSGGRTAGFTGINCLDYKNHITGPNYAIAGNILLGQSILDSMEARFLNEPGDLACKLMASLQGANVPGADTRCLASGTSSKSAFIRVAKVFDVPGNYFLDLNVNAAPNGVEPIDSLQKMFDNWRGCNLISVNDKTNLSGQFMVIPLTTNVSGDIRFKLINQKSDQVEVLFYDFSGRIIYKMKHSSINNTLFLQRNLTQGVYFYQIKDGENSFASGKFRVN
jgi:uncharacterized Ntn-hydrolase superfamily protein